MRRAGASERVASLLPLLDRVRRRDPFPGARLGSAGGGGVARRELDQAGIG
jgi:hypothetical protein